MTGFVQPALASPIKDQQITPGLWCAEEKYDGHRLIVAVGGQANSLFEEVGVRAWSRDGLPRILHPALRDELSRLPNGIYDGELLAPNKRSYGVTVLENADKLIYHVFDVIQLLGRDLTVKVSEGAGGISATYDERRAMLLEIAGQEWKSIKIAWSVNINSWNDVQTLSAEVWKRDGEGLILKRRTSVYHPGKRMKDWLKIKQLHSACLTLVGYQAGTMSPHSIVVLRDDEGFETSVKWKNLAELAKLDANPGAFIGRKLRIEYQERTPDGSYRHPRWDRWENE